MTATNRARAIAEWFTGCRDINDLPSDYLAEQGEELAEAYIEQHRALLSAEAKVAALKKIVAKWEGVENATREYWECAVCGDRYHGDDREAPYHIDHDHGDPLCNICG